MEAKKEADLVKKAQWLCDCGRKTDQPIGDNVKVPSHCACGKAFTKLLEPDGVVTEFAKAEPWFITEFNDHNQYMNETDIQFRQASWMYFVQLKKCFDLQEKIQTGQQKMRNIIEAGARRMKLLKRQNMHWEYNPQTQHFVGWEKGKRGK